ncbi:MAG: hypothetical protein ACYDE0_07780 [Acidiferrobacterales bacterium]
MSTNLTFGFNGNVRAQFMAAMLNAGYLPGLICAAGQTYYRDYQKKVLRPCVVLPEWGQ